MTFNHNTYQITNVGQGYRLRHAKVSMAVSQNNQISIYYKNKELTYKIFEKSGVEPLVMDKKALFATDLIQIKKAKFCSADLF